MCCDAQRCGGLLHHSLPFCEVLETWETEEQSRSCLVYNIYYSICILLCSWQLMHFIRGDRAALWVQQHPWAQRLTLHCL